jgi:hypothetical protein
MAAMYPYDPALLAAIPSRATTVDGVLAGMQAMDAVLSDADGLKWFHWLYFRVTQTVRDRLAAGAFERPAWLAELDVRFAGFYFAALRAQLSGGCPPACWRALFDRRNVPAIVRLQFALAGANAHINHDLPAAICATGVEPVHFSAEYRDYTLVNSILNSLIDVAKQQLMVRLLGDALPPVSRVEDILAAWSIVKAREAAWDNGEILWHLQAVPVLSTRFLDRLDGLTSVAGKTLLTPVA